MKLHVHVATLLTTIGLLTPVAARAQDPATVEAVAPLLMAEDQRAFDLALYSRATSHADPVVRNTAVIGIGRIGDPAGEPLLMQALNDRDPSVVANAFFALGLLGDTTAVPAIIARLRSPDSLSAAGVAEAATALDRIGGTAAAQFVSSVLSASTDLSVARQAQFLPSALVDAWHLGRVMPAAAIVAYATDTSAELRWRSLYSLGRMRVPAAGRVLLGAARDRTPIVRETVARFLDRRLTDTAQLAASAATTVLVRLLDDEQAGIRINAVGSLATFRDSTTERAISQLLGDGDANVRVAAVTALAQIPGHAAALAVTAALDRKDNPWAVRRAALTTLARLDTAALATRIGPWLTSTDFRDRVAALDALSRVASSAAPFENALADRDSRVRAAALGAWGRSAKDTAQLHATVRKLIVATDPELRAAAIGIMQRFATIADLDTLLAAWQLSLRDPGSDARLAVLSTMHALSRRSPDVLMQLSRGVGHDFLAPPPRTRCCEHRPLANGLTSRHSGAQWRRSPPAAPSMTTARWPERTCSPTPTLMSPSTSKAADRSRFNSSVTKPPSRWPIFFDWSIAITSTAIAGIVWCRTS